MYTSHIRHGFLTESLTESIFRCQKDFQIFFERIKIISCVFKHTSTVISYNRILKKYTRSVFYLWKYRTHLHATRVYSRAIEKDLRPQKFVWEHSSSQSGSNLLRTTGGHVVARMHRTAVGHTAAFRVSRGTTIETGPAVVMGALQKLDALFRRAGARRRQRRAADHRGDDVVDIVVVRFVVTAIPQERVQVVLVGGAWQIVNGAGRCRPRRVDASGSRRGVLVILSADAVSGPVVVLSTVELAQIRFLVAPGRPASTLPPSLWAQHHGASSSR